MHAASADFWASMQDALRRDLGRGWTLSTWLRSARHEAGLGAEISELRIFDALVWLSGKRS